MWNCWSSTRTLWKKNPYCRLDQSEAHPGSVDKRAPFALWQIATIRRARPRWPEEPDHRRRWLLCARRHRPRDCPAAEQRDERAALHSITSSAVESSVAGIVRPSILAVSALMTSSNLVACTTGKSAGLAPLRM